MSYRDPAQSIEDPVCELVEVINTFCSAVDSRIASGDWKDTHINELVLLVNRLIPIKYDLLRLAKETW